MDKTSLVNDDVETARRFVAALEREGLPVAAAMWFRKAASDTWMLGIATSKVETDGPLSVIRFGERVRQAGFAASIAREHLTYLNASEQFFSDLALPSSLPDNGVLTLENVNLNGTDIDKAMIFHIALNARPSDGRRSRGKFAGPEDRRRMA